MLEDAYRGTCADVSIYQFTNNVCEGHAYKHGLLKQIGRN